MEYLTFTIEYIDEPSHPISNRRKYFDADPSEEKVFNIYLFGKLLREVGRDEAIHCGGLFTIKEGQHSCQVKVDGKLWLCDLFLWRTLHKVRNFERKKKAQIWKGLIVESSDVEGIKRAMSYYDKGAFDISNQD